MTKAIWRNNNKAGGVTLLDSKIYYKLQYLKQCRIGVRLDKQMEQNSPEMDPEVFEHLI